MSGVHELETVSALSIDPADDTLLTPQDAARFLKVSVSWVYEHVRPEAEDRLPVVKLGKYLRFDRRDLRAYIDAKREVCQRILAQVSEANLRSDCQLEFCVEGEAFSHFCALHAESS